jgi:hypothetical protein
LAQTGVKSLYVPKGREREWILIEDYAKKKGLAIGDLILREMGKVIRKNIIKEAMNGPKN